MCKLKTKLACLVVVENVLSLALRGVTLYVLLQHPWGTTLALCHALDVAWWRYRKHQIEKTVDRVLSDAINLFD